MNTREFIMSDILSKEDFARLINDNYNLFSFDGKWIGIYRIPACYLCKTKMSDIRISPNIHALYRLFNLWQTGELK